MKQADMLGQPGRWVSQQVIACLALLVIASGCNALDEFDDSKPLPVKQASAIPAGLFKFVQVTESDRDGGGWWTTCLHLHLQRDKDDTEEDRPRRFTCDIEIGIPVGTQQQGRISERRAQEVSAEAVNGAVDNVPRDGRITAVICRALVNEVLRLGDNMIDGTKVRQCGKTLGKRAIPEVEWP